jgi:hypothetical protein
MLTERQNLARRGKRLEYFTIAWNSLEGLIAVSAGAIAGSISLVGFGVDSFIEVTSGSALLWRMSMDADAPRREAAERGSLRIVGVCFLALAAYVAVEAVRDLIGRDTAGHSVPGILLACVSLVVMPLLSRAKRRIGTAMQSRGMHADARQAEFCTYLAAILLGGLLVNLLWTASGAVLFMVAWASVVRGQSVAPVADHDDHRVVFELGWAGDWSHDKGWHPKGGTFAFEMTPIEHWLELEFGVSAIRADGVTEVPIDVLFKKPWQFSRQVEFMVGIGRN